MTVFSRLSVLTDEVSQDWDEVLAFVEEYELPYVELRSVWRANVMDIEPGRLRHLRSTLAERGDGCPVWLPCVQMRIGSEPAGGAR